MSPTQTNDVVRPRGHMTLTVYDADGRVADEIANTNRVLDGGRLWLLNLLKGDSEIAEYGLILGAEGFKPEADNPLEQDRIIPVKTTGNIGRKVSGKELVITFRGTVEDTAAVIGGGIVMGGKRGTKEVKDLYNFAETPRPVELAAGQSVSVSFRLAME